MPRRYDSRGAKRRILTTCVRLFLEKGYTETKVAEILKGADVSASSFQNVFHTKDGVLAELVEMMFSGQFGAVRQLIPDAPSPEYIYAVETAVQLALTEMNENLREIYVEAYTYPAKAGTSPSPATAELIHRSTAKELQAAFASRLPDFSEGDFYEIELGTAGIMRGFMVRRCDQYFTLEKKINRFLDMSLSIFRIPLEEREQIIAYVAQVNVCEAAEQVMQALFTSLSMQFELDKK